MSKIDTTVEAMENVIPNPFSDQPVENGPTSTKRHGSEKPPNLILHVNSYEIIVAHRQ